MKKILSLMLAMLASLILLCSCLPIGTTSGGTEGEKEEEKAPESTEIKVVFSSDEKNADLVPTIADALNSINKVSADFTTDSSSPAEIEIAFGNTNRKISEEAYRLLDRINEINDGECRMLIYSDGKSVAIAFDDDSYGIGAAARVATEYFLDNYVIGKSSVSFRSGTLYSGAVDPIEYQREKDLSARNAAIDDKLFKIEDPELRSAISLAIKEYYGLMSNDVLIWLANLYDPEVGGFYYSNSARDTDGYLPDIESTAQALTIIKCCGILDSFGMDELSDIIGDSIISFIKPMQDQNGYFYHPQWDKTTTDKLVERRARDLSNAVSCLATFGAKPTYDTPTGVKGDGIILSSSLMRRLGAKSAVTAVSDVVLASSDYVSPALRDEASFRAYLEAGNVRNNGYGFGSELSSQTSEIIFRDKQLKEEGADYSLCDILIEYLNENQNPDNGVWYWVDKSNPKYSYYAGVNGLLKISGIYTAMGEEIPNATAAAQTAIEAIYSDEDPVGIVDIYNAWFSVENVIKNLSKCAANKEEGDAKVEELRSTLLLNAPVAIRATMQKLSLYRKLDGSFSYLQTQSSCTSSGMPVSVPGTNEGDVNATVIGGLDTGDRMFYVLGLSVPELYSVADYHEFIDELKNMKPVQKKPEPEREPVSFDYEIVGEAPTEVQTSVSTGSSAEVIPDPRNDGDGNVLRLETVSKSNLTVEVSSGSGSVGDSCLVFETDMCLLSGKSGYAVQIYIGESYMLCLRLDEEGVNFFDSSSPSTNKIDVDFCASVAYGEWFNIRIEYYPGTHDTVRAKTYLDGEVIAVSDNYYDYYGNKINEGTGSPATYYPTAKIFAMSSSEFVMLVDNMLAEKVKQSYEPYTDPDNQPVVNVDAPEREELVYTFDTLPEDFSVVGGANSVEASAGELNLKGIGEYNVYIPANIRKGGASCSVLEATLECNSANTGATIQLAFTEMSYDAKAAVIYQLKAIEEYGETVISLYEASGGATGARISNVTIPIGEEIKLKIEFYKDEGATLVYLDDKIVAMSSVTCTGANKLTVGKLKVTNLAKGNFNLSIDSLKFEKASLSFDSAVEPEIDRVVNNFDSGIGNCTLGQGASLTTGGSDGAVSLSGDMAYVDIPVNKRSDITSAVIFEAAFSLSSSRNCKFRISLLSSDNLPVLVYEVRVSGNKATIHEVSKNAVYESPIAEFNVGAENVLTVEYYTGAKTIHLYIGDKLENITNFTYSDEYSEIAYARISSLGGTLSVDDVVLESLNKLYKKQSVIKENAEDSSEVLDFESSTGGNLPKRVTVTLTSGGASVMVKEVLSGAVASKAVVIGTNSGGADTLKLSEADSGKGDAMILETGISVDMSGSIYTYFRDASGNLSFRININVDQVSSGGGVRIDDNSGLGESYGYGTLGNPLSGKTRGEWFDLRIELVNRDGGNIVAVIFVDGNYFATSTEAAWAGKNALDIKSVEFTTSNGSVGSFAIDEISLSVGDSTDLDK